MDTTPPSGAALDVVVVGAGQAGLAVAHHLRRRGLRFLVVEAAHEIGSSWRSRWDSLRLFTPAQHDGLPAIPFPAPADTHPTKDEVADYLVAYAAELEIPVLLDCRVLRLERDGDTFAVHTSQGLLAAHQVVVATGPFQEPVVPSLAVGLAPDVHQRHSAAYTRPADLPAGPVVVVGGGNSGRQIALELSATHEVALAVGTPALQLPQRVLGRDLFWWLTRLGVLDSTPDSLLARRMRARGDLVIGTPLRHLTAAGVAIRPRVVETSTSGVRFQDGSVSSPRSVVWATGFRSDHSWIDVPGALERGQVVHQRGVSAVPGLFFIGLPWQHTRGSSLLGFVQHDAEWISTHLTTHTRKEVRS